VNSAREKVRTEGPRRKSGSVGLNCKRWDKTRGLGARIQDIEKSRDI
jgi:hypothetical protein